MQQPLAGIRVVDLTRILSGPFCTMILGDLGADVVKVEAPEGDHVRNQGVVVDGLSWYFASFNRNKRSIALDLRSDDGKAILARLIESADVLAENFRPGVMAAMGFGRERLRALNPRLVVASVNGYGSEGPYVDRPAFDFIAQAMSGFMSVNGTPETGPLRAAPPLTDLIAGLYAALGVVAALRVRDRDGAGQAVEASMVNGMVSMMAYLASTQLATGRTPPPTGNDHPVSSPYGLFHAADGDVAVAPATPPILRRFLRLLDLEWMLSDPRYDSNDKRIALRREVHGLVDEKMAGDSVANWVARLNAAGVPCGRVQSLAEVFADPQVLAQEMVIAVDHPGRGSVRMTGFPVKLSATPCRVRLPAPELGAHADTVLAEVGFSDEEIDAFRRRNII